MDEALQHHGTLLVESPKRQLKNLRKRNQLFRGSSLSAANFRQTSESARSFGSLTLGFGSYVRRTSEAQRHVEENGGQPRILQEISNSAMRKRRKISQARGAANATSPRGALGSENTGPRFTSPRSSAGTSSNFSSPRSQTSSPESPRKSAREHRRHLRMLSNTFRCRRSSSSETSKYIEHLEANMLALQTQLRSIQSPSNKRDEAAKMRAMSLENHSLQQENAEWETKFNTRLKDHAKQYEVAAQGLRAQLKALQKENEILRAEMETKFGKLDAAENANYDLERRLELMSELLAASPTKLRLHSVDSTDIREQRRKTYHPRVFGTETSSKPLFSPNRRPSLRSFPSSNVTSKTDRLPPSPQADSREENLIDRLNSPRNSLSSSADMGSEVSESTLIESPEASPTRRRSWMRLQHMPDGLQQRPCRRMRRFFTGANGPRSLILPAAASDVTTGFTPIAGLPTSSAPQSTISDLPSSALAPPWLSDRNAVERRASSLWDEEELATSKGRQLENQPPIAPNAQKVESARPGEDFTSSNSSQSTTSFAHVTGRNLFDELSRMKRDTGISNSSPSDALCPLTATKHLDSLSQAPSDEDAPPESSPTTPSALLMDPPPSDSPKTYHSFSSPADPPWSLLALSILPTTWTHLTDLPEILSAHVFPTRHVLTATWSRVILSRPVLKFRWWLVRVLLGRLRDKHLLCFSDSPRRGRKLSLGIVAAEPGSSPGKGNGAGEVRLVVEERGARDAMRVPEPPVVGWLRFSATMVCAVGIAIKDGPGSLFERFDGKGRGGDGFAVVEVESTGTVAGCGQVEGES